MSEGSQRDYLEKVYAEAGQWLRMSNQIIWAMGALFVPLSLSPFWLVIGNRAPKTIFVTASIGLFIFWIVVSSLYRRSTSETRKVLIQIEEYWGLEDGLSLYKRQDPIMRKGFSLIRFQITGLIILMALWLIVILRLR